MCVGQLAPTDAYHIATAAFYGMDVLLTWNCRHMANEFTLPKTYGVLRDEIVKLKMKGRGHKTVEVISKPL